MKNKRMNIEKKLFGIHDGREVDVYTLTNDNGMSADIITFGGAIQKLIVPDRDGKLADVVCGYDDLDSYVGGDGYQGALIGRFGNRIGKGKFTLDGVEYTLYQNDGTNHLHGGKVGFSHKIWDAVASVEDDGCCLDLSYISPDGEEGYPGTLTVNVRYKLSSDNALSINYRATTAKRTIVNLTNHSYFNLGGFDSGKVFDHVMQSDAESFLETDVGLIPTGKIIPVDNTPFDFREPKTIGRDFDLSYEPMRLAAGYDNCLNFPKSGDPLAKPRITVLEENSGRVMELYTDMPAVHFYTGNFLNNPAYPFKGGYVQTPQILFFLETQFMPDSINKPHFTNCVLKPGEIYDYTTEYRFSAK